MIMRHEEKRERKVGKAQKERNKGEIRESNMRDEEKKDRKKEK